QGRDDKGRAGDLPVAGSARRHATRGEERQESPGRSRGIAVIEVVGEGVVEIHRELHQAQAQSSHIEVQVALRISGDRRDVVDSRDSRAHETRSFPAGTSMSTLSTMNAQEKQVVFLGTEIGRGHPFYLDGLYEEFAEKCGREPVR